MSINKRTWSIRQILITLIIFFTITFSAFSFLVISNIYKSNHEEFAATSIKHWANELSTESKKYLIKANRQALYDKLSLSAKIPYLNYVHIYKYNKKEQTNRLFYSYKRNEKRTSIASKSNEIKQLSKPKFTQDYIEYMQPIKNNNEIIGYIYLQSTNNFIHRFKDSFINLSILVVAVILIVSIACGLMLDKYLSSAYLSIIQTIQNVSRKKTFTEQFKAMPYREADMLAVNINALFTRVTKHIEQLQTSKKDSDNHALELESIINQRTAALKESNQELVATVEKMHLFQGQLVENEKMASLGELVAGIAHEVNTPIGLGVTASSILSDRLTDIKTAFDEKSLKSSHLKRFIEEGTEHISIIHRNLNRAADLISTFKKVAVGQSDEEISKFNMKELINDVLLTLRPQLDNCKHKVHIDCPENLIVTSKIGPVHQILINLLMNSIVHAFEGIEQGDMNITIMEVSNQVSILYQDNGNGIDESIKDRVFEPFTTTKRGEGGSGLGLHLVYNLITQGLKGTITISSEAQQGVIIDIHFPINLNHHLT